MDRRSFLKTLVGGVAAAAAVRTWPFRVYSFASEPVLAPMSIRFLRAYDVFNNKMINRFDVLHGFQNMADLPRLMLPDPIHNIEGRTLHSANGLTRGDIERFKRECSHFHDCPEFPIDLLLERPKPSKEPVQMTISVA